MTKEPASDDCYDSKSKVEYPRHNFCPRPGGGPDVCIHCGMLENGTKDPSWGQPIAHQGQTMQKKVQVELCQRTGGWSKGLGEPRIVERWYVSEEEADRLAREARPNGLFVRRTDDFDGDYLDPEL